MKINNASAGDLQTTISDNTLVKLTDGDIKLINEQANEFINELVSSSGDLQEIRKRSNLIQSIGNEEIKRTASISSRLLERPVQSMASGFFDSSSPISQALLDLRSTIEELDPSNHRNLITPKRIFGIIPFGGNIRKYFRKYQSAQSHINAIICSLNNGKDELLIDNATIEEEQAAMLNSLSEMEKHVHFGKMLDDKLVVFINTLDSSQSELKKRLEEDLLFCLRQKIQDILTQLAVSIQGYLAMDLIVKNNIELIKGIDRSINTTVSALKTAVTVAQALANERLVLEQINALNQTTGMIIENTSEALKKQASQIHNNASNNTIEIEKIKIAFSNIYQSIDMINTFKTGALENMKETIDSLTAEMNTAKRHLIAQQDGN